MLNPRSSRMDLGEDVVFQILVKLPVRSLLRFRSVCKDWCALIKSCGFNKAYLALRRAAADDDQLVRVKVKLLHYNQYRSPYTISFTCWFDDYKTIISLPDLPNNDDEFELSGNYSGLLLKVINHVDGIVCLIIVDEFQNNITQNWFDIILVNPALRETRKLPIPSFKLGGFKHFLEGCGFGYGINDADFEYKVVAIVTVEEEGSGSGPPPYKHIALVYYLKTNSWKTLGDMAGFVPPFESLASEESIFSRGSIHWCMRIRDYYDDPQEDGILAFDTTNESFRVILYPCGWKYNAPQGGDDAMYPSLLTIDKSTFALVYCTSQRCDPVGQEIQVWVMKEYGDRDSWTLEYSIKNVATFCYNPKSSCAVSFWKKDKLLVNSKHGSPLMLCYDLLKGQLDEEEAEPEPERLSDQSDQWGTLVTGHETLVSVKQV